MVVVRLSPCFVVRGELRARWVSIGHCLRSVRRWTTCPDLAVACRSEAGEDGLAESGARRSGDGRGDPERVAARLNRVERRGHDTKAVVKQRTSADSIRFAVEHHVAKGVAEVDAWRVAPIGRTPRPRAFGDERT